jgi:hypothetical protein
MKTPFTLFIFISFPFFLHAQGIFVPGYFINNQGERIDCLVKDEDWKNTPRGFDWKTGPDAGVQRAEMEEVAEFGLEDRLRFVRAEVDIDRSSDADERLDNQRAPQWVKDTVFLEQLLEGEADLFQYRDNILYRFFYRKADGPIQQLVYKRYFAEVGKIATNNRFRQQLWVDLNCRGRDVNDIQVRYEKASLRRYFRDYNQCAAGGYTEYRGPNPRKPWRIRLTPGMDVTSLTLMPSRIFGYDSDFGTQNNFRMGLEGEYFLPVTNDRWSVVGELVYQQFSGTDTTLRDVATIDYKSVELYLGGRFNYRFADQVKGFVGLLYSPPFTVNTGSIQYENLDAIELQPVHAAAAEMGIEIWRLRLSGRLQTRRKITRFWDDNYNKYTVILGIRLY